MQWLESNHASQCLIGLVISAGDGDELHLKVIFNTCGLFTMNKESLTEEQGEKWFQIHQCSLGITKALKEFKYAK